jgi:2'-5' RNA ligase
MSSTSDATERLFVAYELDDAARSQLAPQAVALAAALGGQPVPAANLHMTLVFLGATPAADLDAIHQSLRRACRHVPALDARQLATSGSPRRRQSRIVAAVFDDPDHRIQGAAIAIAAALAWRWSITPVPLPFWPHVTLARLRRPEPVATVPTQSEQTFAFDRITLYASRSAPSGPAHYVPLARIALTANDRPH